MECTIAPVCGHAAFTRSGLRFLFAHQKKKCSSVSYRLVLRYIGKTANFKEETILHKSLASSSNAVKLYHFEVKRRKQRPYNFRFQFATSFDGV